MENSIFFHWGPGANADVERIWFNQSLPVDWWNQPIFSSNTQDSYKKLIQNCLEHVNKSPGQVNLVAHSFGCYLARSIADSLPQKINHLFLLSPGIDSFDTFHNLAKTLILSGHSSLNSLLVNSENSRSPSCFWTLVQAIAQTPNYFNHYWGPESEAIMVKYLEIAAQCSALNMDAFSVVIDDHLKNYNPSSLNNYAGKTTVCFGDQDPLIDIKKSAAYFKSKYPNAKILDFKCGHFIQFERPISDWFFLLHQA